jgi:hypothetical protein
MAATRKCLSTDEEFSQAVAESLSVRQVLGRIGLVPAGGNYKTVHARIKKLGLNTAHFTGTGWNAGGGTGCWANLFPGMEFWWRTPAMPLLFACETA